MRPIRTPTARRQAGRNPMFRRLRPDRRRWRSAARAAAVPGAWFGCGAATARWSRRGLGLDRAARRQIQQGLQSAGFDPGGADGLFGPRTRAAIRRWQSSRGARSTGYLDGASASGLRAAGGSAPAVAAAASSASPTVLAAQERSRTSAPAAAPAASAAQENLFWQSIMNSTNAAEFEAYLRQFPRTGCSASWRRPG